MALFLDKEVKGTNHPYWWIKRTGDEERLSKMLRPVIACYPSKEAKDINPENFGWRERYDFPRPLDWDEKTLNEKLTWLYEKIKEPILVVRDEKEVDINPLCGCTDC